MQKERWSPNGRDDIGPFTGREIGDALVGIGWELDEAFSNPPADIAQYVKAGVNNEIHIDWEKRNMYWGDPTCESITGNMVNRDMTGRRSRSAVKIQKQELLDELRRRRRNSERG